MDGVTFGLSLGSAFVGAILSYIVSRHFFKKGVKEKSLVPYIQFKSKLFSEIDPELKESLVVNYKDHKVENIIQTQFIIANTGEIAIKDIIKPLQLILPKRNKIFSVSIIYVEPKGREVGYEIVETENSNIVKFDIPLLNGGEYFIVKLLVQDFYEEEESEELKEPEFIFNIVADELPPTLKVKDLPYSYYEKDKSGGSVLSTVVGSIVFLIFFVSTYGTILSHNGSKDSLNLLSPSQFFNSETFGFYNICILVLAIFMTLVIFIIGILLFETLNSLRPNKKTEFKVPRKLRKGRQPFPFELFD